MMALRMRMAMTVAMTMAMVVLYCHENIEADCYQRSGSFTQTKLQVEQEHLAKQIEAASARCTIRTTLDPLLAVQRGRGSEKTKLENAESRRAGERETVGREGGREGGRGSFHNLFLIVAVHVHYVFPLHFIIEQ